jgi:hypothetical protein
VIPHLRGREILLRCLRSVWGSSTEELEVILVDNGSTDGSTEVAAGLFPLLKILRPGKNLGYAGGCNLGIAAAQGEFILLLNDDAEVTPGFLRPLVERMAHDSSIAVCQPKVRSIRHPERFDYAGAAGGYLDVLGFPFCRGRLFDHCEDDHGQYDSFQEIFWASGACCLVRAKVLNEVGLLDESFFAHMEEIDLQWRMHRAGYRIMAIPASLIRHDAGSTLGPDTPQKVYLNHRNSLIMLLKNQELSRLLVTLPARITLDLVAMVYRALRGELLNALAVLRALGFVLFRFPTFLAQRTGPYATAATSSLYNRSIVVDYFFLNRRKFSDLPNFTEWSAKNG